MSYYTKEEFEVYKGDNKFLEVNYLITKKHKTYEDYLEFYNKYLKLEQNTKEQE